MDDFKAVKENAWSLSPNEEASGMALIFVEETSYGTFKYYKDLQTGEYRYQSAGTEKFNREMKEKEKERKACLRRSEYVSKKDSA